ncbi:hypothetical protein PHMEG_00030700 [Phytophthora megakarya]|uniref:BED-type domain-containing protein n=1 Tax=Phytophthora megakarya TaxID=4795 RepID=A0A225UZF9_9STRA|nr:hypothetical protein PHMEG_00030700 [Phytophthora megakarya]
MSDALLARKPSKGKFTPKQACKACGKTRKHMPKTGYTNLASHVRGEHPRFEDEMEATSAAVTSTLLPYTNLPPVCKETIGHDMESVAKTVEKNSGAVLPDKFGAILDDWTHDIEHYMAVYACFELNGVRHRLLLSLAPVINGPDNRLNEGIHMASMAAFQETGAADGVSLVGCTSHRLNLVVCGFLKPYEDDLEQVQSLMRRLRTITQASKLRYVILNFHALGSTYSMLARYFELREFISADDEELAEGMSEPTTNRLLNALLTQLGDVKFVVKKLQSEGLNLLDCWMDFWRSNHHSSTTSVRIAKG